MEFEITPIFPYLMRNGTGGDKVASTSTPAATTDQSQK
jgi:hypothetical protein